MSLADDSRFSPKALAKRGIELIDPYRVWFRCLECRGTWSPNTLTGGRFPRHWWQCPHHGCNRPQA